MFLDDQAITNPLRVDPTDASCSHDNIVDAIDEATTTGNKTILITTENRNGGPCVWQVTSNLDIPQDFALLVPNGARINTVAGVTLTISGTLIAGDHVIFEGPGTVLIGRRTPIKAIWYGAVCDDVTDVAGAIQRALNTASTGNTVELLSGTCRIGATLSPTGGLTLTGRGAGNTVIMPMPSANLTDIIFIQDTSSLITIRDLTIDGNAALNPQLNQRGITANQYDGVQITRVAIRNVGFTAGNPTGAHLTLRCLEASELVPGFVTGGACINAVIQDSTFDDSGGIASSGIRLLTNPDVNIEDENFEASVTDNHVIRNSFFGGFLSGAVILEGPGTHRNTVSSNTFHDVESTAAIFIRSGSSLNHVTDNTISVEPPVAGNPAGVFIQGNTDINGRQRFSFDNTVRGNLITVESTVAQQGFGVRLRMAVGAAINDNTIQVNYVPGAESGIGVNFDGALRDADVSNNIVRALTCMFMRQTGVLANQTGWFIRSNSMRCDQDGINFVFLDPSFSFQTITVSQNLIGPWQRNPMTGVGLQLGTRVDQSIIHGNTIISADRGIIVGGARPTIKDNIIRDVRVPITQLASSTTVVTDNNLCVSSSGSGTGC